MKTMLKETTLTRLDRVTLRQISRDGLLATATAVGGNLLVYALARALNISLAIPMIPGNEPIQLPIGMVIAASMIGVLAGTMAFTLLGTFVPRGVRYFHTAGIVFLILSLAGPLSLEDTSGVTKATLILMHIVAGGAVIGLLSRMGMASPLFSRRRRMTSGGA